MILSVSALAQDTANVHEELHLGDRLPSAETCKKCHPKHYREWSVSQHAFAIMSPVFDAMQRTINRITSGTLGDFCVRCHTPVGTTAGEDPYTAPLERHPISREGVTCVACHRVNKEYGKVSGRISFVEGGLLETIFGPRGNAEMERVLANGDKYQVVTEPDALGRKIHRRAERFFQISTSASCGTCHDVTVANGFRMFETFSEYKSSPAAKNGVSCQDCHMGETQGVASGYEQGPASEISGVPTAQTKLTNHFFAGPDSSIVHPGLFPHNAEAADFATPEEWLQFDYRAGWGTDAFEENVSDAMKFPARWDSADDRFDALEIVNAQLELLEWARQQRLEAMRNGFGLGEIEVRRADRGGIQFGIDVHNLTDGHNVPSGLPERLIFLQVLVSDGDGKVVYTSGDRDPNGDIRDNHSIYVHHGELAVDEDLFNLQSLFIARNQRGGEREVVLAVNTSLDPLPFVRPFPRSSVLVGQPGGIRVHRKSIEPLGRRRADYSVPGSVLGSPGTYRITIKMIAQMMPVNVVATIMDVGFAYGLGARTVGDRLVEQAEVLWQRTAEVRIE